MKKKKANKNIILILIIISAVLVFSIFAYLNFKSPEKTLGIGANIEEARLGEDGKTAYIKLAGGINYGNITKVKFVFTDNEGNKHYFETREGASEISVPFKRSFWQWLLQEPAYKGKYDYQINSTEINLENFNNINEVSAVFEYQEAGKQVTTPALDTTKPTQPQQSPGGGGGGGGGGQQGCIPSKTCLDYPAQCGIGLNDGCNDILDCYGNCENGTYCYTGEGTKNVCINNSITCIDSDGEDHYVKGNITINNSIIQKIIYDSCNGNLTEFYCFYNGTIFEERNETYVCPNGCSSGACNILQCTSNDNCSELNLPEIATCNNTPDNNPSTWDYASSSISICDLLQNNCTFPSQTLTHTCDKTRCGAECDAANSCPATICDKLTGCQGDDYYQYQNVSNLCSADCSCSNNSCNNFSVSQNDSYCIWPSYTEISIATLRNVYETGQKIELTDPSENNFEYSTDNYRNAHFAGEEYSPEILTERVVETELPNYAPGEIIIKFKEDPEIRKRYFSSAAGLRIQKIETKFSSVNKLNEEFQVEKIEKVLENKINGFENIYKLKIKEKSIEEAVEDYSKDPNVEYVHPNYIFYTSLVPNDPRYAEQWTHQNTQAELGWDMETGNSETIIAIIDTGVDYSHEDIQDNIYSFKRDFVDINTQEYINYGCSLISGEDYTIEDDNPIDYNGHGTHCAGIAAGVGDNNLGISGVCPKCKIMPMRAGFSIMYKGVEYGSLESDDVARAIISAADNGADVISMSFGGSADLTMKTAVDYAYSKNVTLVAAAGNSNTSAMSYPAAWDEVVSVAATSKQDKKAYYSSYGAWVDVAAPGGDKYTDSAILSTVPRTGGRLSNLSGYQAAQGTSMATPYVAGLAGLIVSKNNNLNNEQVKWILKHGVDILGGQNYYIGTGRVNVRKSLQINASNYNKAKISTPTSGTVIYNLGNLEVKGTAKGSKYTLYYGNGAYPLEWHKLNNGSIIENGTLGFWDNSQLTNGVYTLKLVVEDGGNEITDFAVVNLFKVEGWPFNPPLKHPYYGLKSPVVVDIDKDNELEIIVLGSAGIFDLPLHSDLFILGPDGKIEHEKYLADSVYQSLTIADIDDDADLEILVVDSDGLLLSLDKEGNEEWRFDGGDYTSYNNHPMAADLNNDKVTEIILPVNIYSDSNNKIGALYILNVIGNAPVVKAKVETDENVYFQTAIGDVDDNNQEEIIVSTTFKKICYEFNQNQLTEKWRIDNPRVTELPAIGNVDNKDSIDIISPLFFLDGFIANIDAKSGQIAWKIKLQDFDSEAGQYAGYETPPTIIDINGDGLKEIIIVGRTNYLSQNGTKKIYAFDSTATNLLWSTEMNENHYFEILTADLNQDGEFEIILESAYNISVLNGSGDLQWKRSINEFWTNLPAIADIDQNGDLEIITVERGKLDIFDKNGQPFEFKDIGSASFNPMPWPMYRHDAQRTGSYTPYAPPSNNTCGNNIKEENEACDGTDSPNCPNRCSENCSCLPESKIINNGDSELTGNLIMILQKENAGEWTNVQIVVDESITISPKSLVKLDNKWNPKDVTVSDPGNYRVYVSFEHNGKIINSSWQFIVNEGLPTLNPLQIIINWIKQLFGLE